MFDQITPAMLQGMAPPQGPAANVPQAQAPNGANGIGALMGGHGIGQLLQLLMMLQKLRAPIADPMSDQNVPAGAKVTPSMMGGPHFFSSMFDGAGQ